MKTESKAVRVIPYGRLIYRMQAFAPTDLVHPLRMSKTWKRVRHAHELWHLLIAFSDELDEGFVRTFRKRATPDTRLLVLNDSRSSDRLLSRIVDLQIRSPHRFYVADPPFQQANEKNLEDSVLHVISADFQRLEVPVSKIAPLSKADKETAEHFEIDEDGSYIYWPDLDLHLGWQQLQQIVDPVAVQKAKQKSREFNVRYGAAIRKIREEKGLDITAIPGLSAKQLRRIERGECRVTSNAARKLAQAHGMSPNEYLQTVAATLQ